MVLASLCFTCCISLLGTCTGAGCARAAGRRPRALAGQSLKPSLGALLALWCGGRGRDGAAQPISERAEEGESEVVAVALAAHGAAAGGVDSAGDDLGPALRLECGHNRQADEHRDSSGCHFTGEHCDFESLPIVRALGRGARWRDAQGGVGAQPLTARPLTARRHHGRLHCLQQVRLPPPDKAVVEARAPTLVVYVFSGSDPEYAGNLRFFVREAVRVRKGPPTRTACLAAALRATFFWLCHSGLFRHLHRILRRFLVGVWLVLRRPATKVLPCTHIPIQSGDGCQYLIVLQEGEGLELPDPLPDLPSNARYLRHENACYDIGTVGWVLEKHINVQFFKYYVWLNSSVRGPFLPAYLRGRLHWTEPLLSRLSPAVKLVGATINCGRAYELPPTPHVQSYVAATDAAGLEVLLATGRVFKCWESMRETVINSEIGASVAIMGAGYTIDSLMLRYQVGG